MMRRKRKSKLRELRKRVLILCEGAKTEPNYFNGIKHSIRVQRRLSAVDIEVYQPNSYSPMGLLKEAISKKEKANREMDAYDAIWLVFDRDSHFKIEETFEKSYIYDIHIAFSNICFEYWVLLHYEKTDRPFSKCGNLINYIKQNHITRYHKNSNHYDHLKEHLDFAIQNAQWLVQKQAHGINKDKPIYEQNPYTNVHELVQFLLEL